jgi:hypothetical protein
MITSQKKDWEEYYEITKNKPPTNMEVILLDEEEKDDKTANGTPKHWHVFHFIAKKL